MKNHVLVNFYSKKLYEILHAKNIKHYKINDRSLKIIRTNSNIKEIFLTLKTNKIVYSFLQIIFKLHLIITNTKSGLTFEETMY